MTRIINIDCNITRTNCPFTVGIGRPIIYWNIAPISRLVINNILLSPINNPEILQISFWWIHCHCPCVVTIISLPDLPSSQS